MRDVVLTLLSMLLLAVLLVTVYGLFVPSKIRWKNSPVLSRTKIAAYGFGGLVLITTVMNSIAPPRPEQIVDANTTAPAAPAASTLTAASPSSSAAPQNLSAKDALPSKPTVLPDPKYDKVLSGAWPDEERKVRDAWRDYDQAVCTGKTAAKDVEITANLIEYRRDRLIKDSDVLFNPKGKEEAVLTLIANLLSDENEKEDQKLKINPTPCQLKRGLVSLESQPLLQIKQKLRTTAQVYYLVQQKGEFEAAPYKLASLRQEIDQQLDISSKLIKELRAQIPKLKNS